MKLRETLPAIFVSKSISREAYAPTKTQEQSCEQRKRIYNYLLQCLIFHCFKSQNMIRLLRKEKFRTSKIENKKLKNQLTSHCANLKMITPRDNMCDKAPALMCLPPKSNRVHKDSSAVNWLNFRQTLLHRIKAFFGSHLKISRIISSESLEK